MDISSFIPDKQVILQYWLDVIRQCRAFGLTNQKSKRIWKGYGYEKYETEI
nr:hypothetical protein [uncultured Blautia sp.]